jgi:hypothetical protein
MHQLPVVLHVMSRELCSWLLMVMQVVMMVVRS